MPQNVLAIDASSEGCSVALSFRGETYIRESTEPRKHAQNLLPMTDALLSGAQATLADLDYIALVNGPGSFTGIRIAISIVQGLSFGAKLPIYCMSSLITMAEQQRGLNVDAVVVSAIDARMGEVYWAAYDLDDRVASSGLPLERAQPSVMPVALFTQSLLDLSRSFDKSKNLVFVGSGFNVSGLDEALDKLDDLKIYERNCSIEPSAAALLRLALIKKPTEADFCLAENVEPLYLRNEVAWKKRERIRG